MSFFNLCQRFNFTDAFKVIGEIAHKMKEDFENSIALSKETIVCVETIYRFSGSSHPVS